MAEVTYISYSARAKSTTADGIFAEAQQILDVSKNKNQQTINAEVTTELGKKAAQSALDAYKSANDAAVAKKADKTAVDSLTLQVGQKVDITAFNEHKNSSSLLISAKADKSYVDTELGKKANSADVYKKGEVDTKLAAKANSADVYTKGQTDSAIASKVNAAVGSVYRVKGTKATIAEVTALTNVKCGDVWNVTAEFTLGGKKYPAGTNVVALADKSVADAANWDPLGGTVDMAGHTAEMKSWANGQFAGKAYEAKVTTNTQNISGLTTRLTTAEGKITANTNKFANYYTKNETDTKLGTKANSADVYTKSQVYTKDGTDTAIRVESSDVKKKLAQCLYVGIIKPDDSEPVTVTFGSTTVEGPVTFGPVKPLIGSEKHWGFYREVGGKYYSNGNVTTVEGYEKVTSAEEYKKYTLFSDGVNLYTWGGPLTPLLKIGNTVGFRAHKVLDIASVVVGGTITDSKVDSASGDLVLVVGGSKGGTDLSKYTYLCLKNGGKYYTKWNMTEEQQEAVSQGYLLRTPDGSIYASHVKGTTKSAVCVVDASKIVANTYTKAQVDSKFTTTNNNVNNLSSRVTAVEGKFSGYVPTATYNALAARVTELENLLKLA